MNIITVSGAIVSKSGVTLYLTDGTQMDLSKHSHKTKAIMDEVAKPLAARKTVALDLDRFSAHSIVERKTGGLLRFAIEKTKSFLGFKGAQGGTFGTQKLGDDETVVATIHGKKIPGVQALEAQIERAALSKDCKGFKLFMERLAAVIDERGHSVQELLTFMESADLPIADDGSIVAYKTLSRSDKENVFVDVHSRTVFQKLGSRVSMPMDAVDDSRRRECSTGLHIARRSYLRHYFGDLLTLVKVAPEDVIAVPTGEANKMRAMAYHIVAVLSPEATSLIRNNRAMTSNSEAARMLANVIAGDHIGVIEEVRIFDRKEGAKNPYDKNIEVENSGEIDGEYEAGDNGSATALDEHGGGVVIDIRNLNQTIAEEVATAAKAGDMSVAISDKEPKKAKKKKAKKPKKTVDPTLSDAEQNRQSAMQAVLNGMSQREAAAKFKVCAKTLRKMLKEAKSK